jgi:uncharacterized lipoprotein YddW (UPF0748 family)
MIRAFIIIVFSFAAFLGCKPNAELPYPKYWCWIGDRQGLDWEDVIKDISDMGIGGILVNGSVESYKKVAPLAEQYGIELHAWRVIMLAGKELADEHPEWLSVNKNGVSLADTTAYVPYYRFMCPILPEVRNHIYNGVKEVLAIDGVKGISLDYTRYVDVILPENLWSKYDIVQDKEYPRWDYGYHPAMIKAFKERYGYNPQLNETTGGDTLWNQFRYNQITEIANEISRMVRAEGKTISASPFPTPSIARKLVRQDWDKWELDLVFPMIYNSMYKEEGADWMSKLIEENVSAMEDKDTYLYTGVYVPGHRNTEFDLSTALKLVEESESVGLSLFDYHTLTDEEKEVVKSHIQHHR